MAFCPLRWVESEARRVSHPFHTTNKYRPSRVSPVGHICPALWTEPGEKKVGIVFQEGEAHSSPTHAFLHAADVSGSEPGVTHEPGMFVKHTINNGYLFTNRPAGKDRMWQCYLIEHRAVPEAISLSHGVSEMELE